MRDDVFASPAARRSAAARVLLLAGSFVVAAVAVERFVPSATDPAWLRSQLTGLGWYAPLAFVALQTVQVVVAPIPGQILGGVGGYLFGSLPGVVYSMIGVTAGSAIVFFASRRFGRPYVERVIAPAKLDQWDAFVDRKGAVGLFVFFLLPTFPDDLLCFVAALSDLRARRFLALVVVGRTPSFLLVAYVGTRVSHGALVRAGVLVAALGVVSVVVYLYRRRLVLALGGDG
ncbi:TVP38/TMEM64 family protein [Halobellus sp. EA9]|uniref:TVP38/TMEM64 family protein n=1 Tax=Halobellus sp. EA9 TaxID=3421647 RepID=UPI003EB91D77